MDNCLQAFARPPDSSPINRCPWRAGRALALEVWQPPSGGKTCGLSYSALDLLDLCVALCIRIQEIRTSGRSIALDLLRVSAYLLTGAPPARHCKASPAALGLVLGTKPSPVSSAPSERSPCLYLFENAS